MVTLLLSFFIGLLQGVLFDDPAVVGVLSLIWIGVAYGFYRLKSGRESEGMLDLPQLPISVFKSEYEDMPIDEAKIKKPLNIFLTVVLGNVIGVLVGLVLIKSSL